jgi:hypothetical protein
MKKQLLALALLTAGFSNAQTWTETFSSAASPGIPSTWLQNNVDGNVVTTSLASYSFGTNAWVTRDFSASTNAVLAAHGKIAFSTSWYTPAGTANDWLISPSFTVPANAVLEWEALVTDPSYPDGYQVRISTTGTTVANFTANPVLFSIAAENDTWTTRGLSLNTYSNQTVRIAFVNNSVDMDRLALDNIMVKIPQSNDGNVVSITGLTRYIAISNTQTTSTIAGAFKSFGYSTASSAELKYSINNGTPVTQTVSLPNLTYGQTSNYSFTTPGTFALGTNKVKVWVTKVNGVNEVALANDTAYSVVYVASTTKPRNALVEEFSSSTCNPCASLNSTFDPLLNTNNPNTGGNVNVIKYQVNWPSPGNDPSYNSHCAGRVSHYGINAAPTAITNGKTEMVAHSQAEINAAIAVPAFADITANINVVGLNITASSTITPYVSIPSNSPLRLHQVILQKFYNYPGATTTQKNYYHVMRKMNPNAWGAPVNVTDGVSFNTAFNHTLASTTTPVQGSFDFWNTASPVFEYVVFVQDSISNDILQTGSASFSVNSVGFVDLKDDQQIGVYPNPAKDFAAVAINLQKSSVVDITIYDITGKIVYNNKGAQVQAGKNEIKINTSDFATGTYNIVVNTDDGILKEKLIIFK